MLPDGLSDKLNMTPIIHYKSALKEAFELNPNAKEIIILEDDLIVSPDFMAYVAQLMDILHSDKTVFCISAWNDQGYTHTTGHQSMLYRVQTMPGLGWVLKRDLFEKELLPKWPPKFVYFDWDMWIRQNHILKNRECVIPDLSRSLHIGNKGVNVHPGFQRAYFSKKSWSSFNFTKFYPNTVLWENYETLMLNLSDSPIFNGNNVCSLPFLKNIKIPRHYSNKELLKNITTIIFIKMNNEKDFDAWISLCRYTCDFSIEMLENMGSRFKRIS
ncbi:hypothetical protein MXB_457 [Myxobolus squamalis]|nr:hypothetical protein MXB_457 [Myxobolus squamalis]